MPDLAPGTELASCRVEEVVGRGGMGVVYRATDLRLDRPVAIKLIADPRARDPDFRERFEREARLSAAIDHPNVIPIYAAGEDDGHLYIVMRFVAGTDLQALLRREGRLDPVRAATIVAQVADALDAAHSAGLVHRDVKPANVLLADDHVYLSDFGITRPVDATTDTGEAMGTVDFMAPEHLRAERTDARSDVYALGCLLHTALTGRPPFHRATVPATILAHLEEDPPAASDTPGVPGELDDVLARALAKEPGDRYASAGDLGRAARAAARGERVTTAVGSVARGPAAAAASAADEPLAIAAGVAAAAVTDVTTRVADRDATAVAPARRAVTRYPRPAAEAPTAHVAAPTRKARATRRRGLFAGLLVVLAGLVAAILLLTLGGGGTRHGPLTTSEVGGIARAFARAYGDRDARALGLLLAPDVQRFSAGTSQRGRAAVLAEYRRQFATNAIQGYRLSGLTITPGPAGRAAGRFDVPRSARGPITGNVVLGVERLNGTPRIRLIATEPPS